METKSSPEGRLRAALGLLAALTLSGMPHADSVAADSSQGLLRNGKIGYALTTLHWANYQTPEAKECPQGMNDGPREQFAKLFPEGGKYTMVEAQIAREAEIWHPQLDDDHGFVFHEPQSKIAYGLNLDGNVGPNDFTDPDGLPGIDNQFYRVMGCVRSYRKGESANDYFESLHIVRDPYNRILIELSDVDSLINDEEVQVTWYRGLDQLAADATGNKIAPGGSVRIDHRFGKRFIQRMKGRIVDGTLVTEPADVTFPWGVFGFPADELVRGMRLKLELMPDGASGLMAGYTDIETWYSQNARSESTHHQSYGSLSQASFYKAMKRLADGYPDAVSGENTAISSALQANFVQVFILH